MNSEQGHSTRTIVVVADAVHATAVGADSLELAPAAKPNVATATVIGATTCGSHVVNLVSKGESL